MFRWLAAVLVAFLSLTCIAAENAWAGRALGRLTPLRESPP
jgi:hypothetical protein